MSALIVVDPSRLVIRREHNYSRPTEADYGDMEELTLSVRTVGVQQPIQVIAAPDGRYDVVQGFRRALAAKAAQAQGWTGGVPAINLDSVGELERVLGNTLENEQREDLHPLGRAACYAKLVALGMPLKEVAKTTGHALDFVRDHVRLLESDPAVLDALRTDAVSWSVIRQVLRVPPAEQAALLAELRNATTVEARIRIRRARTGHGGPRRHTRPPPPPTPTTPDDAGDAAADDVRDTDDDDGAEGEEERLRDLLADVEEEIAQRKRLIADMRAEGSDDPADLYTARGELTSLRWVKERLAEMGVVER